MDDIYSLFEDEHLVAIHKPSGISFHAQDDKDSGIVQRVRTQFNNNSLYPVHRLDRVTSGVMLFAKSEAVNAELSLLLSQRSIEKFYLAVSSTKPKKKQGSIIGDMETSRNGSYKLSKSRNNPAVTRFKSFNLKSLTISNHETQRKFIPHLNCSANWLHLLKIETGKTHQIRVALKSLSSPILGDSRYKGIEADRAYLHAYQVRFKLKGALYSICDNDFKGAVFNLDDVPHDHISCPEKLNWPGTKSSL